MCVTSSEVGEVEKAKRTRRILKLQLSFTLAYVKLCLIRQITDVQRGLEGPAGKRKSISKGLNIYEYCQRPVITTIAWGNKSL